MRLKIDWASLIVGRKFTCFASFYFVSEGTVSKYKPSGGFYFEGQFNGGFYALRVWGEGLVFGGAYFWNFTVSRILSERKSTHPAKGLSCFDIKR